ncbi:ATP-binding cassette domain-containing protein [Microbacterium sp. 22195]|uniref:ATP-binding cassette domain-containing protein n=1 Tax=Microbacterium sp. 22195 TaxID=3453891 RepID=UPI003F847672
MMNQTFTVTDYKGVRNIELSPTGRLVVIAGGNGAGKSSFIDAITELFDPKGTKLTPKPIREGAAEARAEYVDHDLDLRISRVWKKDGTAGTLTVEALDGAKYSTPSKIVADLLGGAIFDPVAFLNLDEKKQRDALLEKVDLPFDLDALAREKAGAEERRLIAGREVKRLEGALASLPKPTAGTPDEEVSGQDILVEIEEAQDIERRRVQTQSRYDEAANLVADYDQQIEDLKRKREEAADRQEVAWGQLRELPDPIDIAPLRERLAAVDDTNRAVRAARQYFEVSGELQVADADHAAAQAELDRIAARKAEGLAAAKFPVDGLSVDDDGVTFNGIPFSQVNSAMRRRVAFAIATAGDPKLKLVIIKDGDLLDADSLAGIAELAEERGYTVLVERDRDESRRIGFTVRDGALDAGLTPIEDVAAAAGLNIIPFGGAR